MMLVIHKDSWNQMTRQWEPYQMMESNGDDNGNICDLIKGIKGSCTKLLCNHVIMLIYVKLIPL